MSLARLAVWAALSLSVRAQIRILTPETLKKHFTDTNGFINGGTSVFGAPYYGERVLGKLRRGISKGLHHCTDEDYELTQLSGTIETNGEKVHDIVVIPNGEYCSACQKVRIAQGKGAHAVVIVDQSDDPDDKVAGKIMADDGEGAQVTIPSILVSKKTGARLFSAMRQETVIVELAWDVPQSEVVSADFWWSSGSLQSIDFLERFKESAEMLGHNLQFRPHYYVFDVPDSVSGDLCADDIASGTRHCAPDPDGPGPITGADVANEDVRQLCLWHSTAIAPAGEASGRFSQEWWEYVSTIDDYCPFDAVERPRRFGSKSCSFQRMESLGINIAQMDSCVRLNSGGYLQESAHEGAWSEQALRINGWRYKGPLDAEVLLKAICSAYATPLMACTELQSGWFRRTIHLFKHRVTKGLNETTFILMISGICVLSVINCFLYRRYIAKLVKRSMREEVMLEVQSQMTEYAKLDGGNGA